MTRPARLSGFTIVELIAVIVISGILAAVVGQNIVQPIQGFNDTARRAALVDDAETAVNRLTREVRLALPNSVRISGGRALEFLRTRTGGRYRALIDPGLPSDALDFALGTDSFDVIGEVKEFGRICTAGSGNCGGSSPAGTAVCMSDRRVDCLVIFNTGQPADCSTASAGRTNAYCGDNVAAVDSVDVAGRHIGFVHDLPDGFPFPSPNQRFHVVDTPVSYLCDLSAQTLTRYGGYAIGALQPTVASPPASSGRVLAEHVVDCRFGYDPGTATRAALVTVEVTLADPQAVNERVSLFEQIHVPNVP